MNILIIKLGAIGDAIRTTSILSGLREKYPSCKIDWVTKKESFDILKNNGFISKIFLIENKEEIRKKNYDLVISLDDDDDACSLASEVKARKIVGACIKNGVKTYTENSSLWFDMGLISKHGKKGADELKAKNKKTYQEIMYAILSLDYKKQEPILLLNKKELEFGKIFAMKNNIKRGELIIGINTGAGGRWQDKKLGIEQTSILIDRLNSKLENKKIKMLLFGGPEEVKRNKEIISLAKTKIIDAGCNNSLMEFASLVGLCDILVTSDSLALHVGTALKKKIVAFFYPTSSEEIELYNGGIKIIGKGKSYCSYESKCTYPPKWDVDEMVDAVKKLV